MMRTRPFPAVLPALAALAVALGGCEEQLSIACPDIAFPAVNVEIRDAATGANAAPGATLIVARGAEVLDSLLVPAAAEAQVPGGWSESGTLTVRVRKAGYQFFTREDVRVRENSCGQPDTEQVRADLVRAP